MCPSRKTSTPAATAVVAGTEASYPAAHGSDLRPTGRLLRKTSECACSLQGKPQQERVAGRSFPPVIDGFDDLVGLRIDESAAINPDLAALRARGFVAAPPGDLAVRIEFGGLVFPPVRSTGMPTLVDAAGTSACRGSVTDASRRGGAGDSVTRFSVGRGPRSHRRPHRPADTTPHLQSTARARL